MGIVYRAWSAQQGWSGYRVIFPALAGATLVAASLLPWLVDPLGKSFSAWSLPIDIGWQVRSGLLNYGVLCLACAFFAFLLVYRAWKALRAPGVVPVLETRANNALQPRSALTLAALLCLLPLGLFFLQYLTVDMTHITELARHEFQATMLRQRLGYGSAAPFTAIDTTTFDPLTFSSRLALLLNHVAPGLFLPLLSLVLLLSSKSFWPRSAVKEEGLQRRSWRKSLLISGAFFLLILLGRSPAALASNFQAKHALAVGNYASALRWLDTARMLNPALDQMASYHSERGQAWYYLHPGEESEEAMLYLASTYRQQKDYLSAYQELLLAWNKYDKKSWVQDDLCITLVRLAEMTKPLTGAVQERYSNESGSLPWLQQLLEIDPANVYGHYMRGRILFDAHNYTGSLSEMETTLDLVKLPDFQSAAYTYMGLSSQMLGNYTQARTWLFAAVDLDREYRNNTARQELSGIR